MKPLSNIVNYFENKNMKRRNDEEQLLQHHNRGQILQSDHAPIPQGAIKPILVAFILICLGIFSLFSFFNTFSDDSFFVPGSRWYFFIVMFLTIPAGSFTLFLAYQAWNRVPGYSWPMIF